MAFRSKPPTPKPTLEDAPAEDTKPKLGPLDTFIAAATKEYGALVIRKASELPALSMISTGCFMLDFALMGGLPQTLVTTLFGSANSGKTTIANRIIAAAQRKHDDRKAVMCDMEGTYDTTWAAYHGVDIDRLLLVQPTCGEEAVDLIVGLIETGEISVIVGDSLAMMTPVKIVNDSAADTNVSPLAKLLTILGNKITVALNAARKAGHPTTVIFTNQWRSKIGVVYGDSRTMPGGQNINEYVPMTRIELKSKEITEEDENKVGGIYETQHSFKLWKTKAGTGLRIGEFQMAIAHDHPQGPGTFLDAAACALYARKFGLLTGSGKNWTIQNIDAKFGKLEEIEAFLYAEPGEFLRLKQAVISAQRVTKGLLALPEDGYLLDWNARENLGL